MHCVDEKEGRFRRGAKLAWPVSDADKAVGVKSEELIVAGDPWRVGVMFSQTGVTAAVERTALQGTVLAIEEINARGGVLDRLIEPVITDPEFILLSATAPRPND